MAPHPAPPFRELEEPRCVDASLPWSKARRRLWEPAARSLGVGAVDFAAGGIAAWRCAGSFSDASNWESHLAACISHAAATRSIPPAIAFKVRRLRRLSAASGSMKRKRLCAPKAI
jgi:hypothetical protein